MIISGVDCMISYICKRDGRIVEFHIEKIANAIMKAIEATHSYLSYDEAMIIAKEVVLKLEQRDSDIPTVELVQDIVEETLMEKDYVRIAKAYILYRDSHMRQRVDSHVLKDMDYTCYVDNCLYVDLVLYYEQECDNTYTSFITFCHDIITVSQTLKSFIVDEGILLHFDDALVRALQNTYNSYYKNNVLRILDLYSVDCSLNDIAFYELDDYLNKHIDSTIVDVINEHVHHWTMGDLYKELNQMIPLLLCQIDEHWSIDYGDVKHPLGMILNECLDYYLKTRDCNE